MGMSGGDVGARGHVNAYSVLGSVFLIGVAAGPVFGAWVANGADYGAIGWAAAIVSIVAVVALLPLTCMVGRSTGTPLPFSH